MSLHADAVVSTGAGGTADTFDNVGTVTLRDDATLVLGVWVVAAPVTEELFCRGFLFRGLEEGLGGRAAVIVTSLLFTLVHIQYDLYGMTQALAIGLLFGVARLKTGSTTVTMAMHMTANAIATAEAAILS